MFIFIIVFWFFGLVSVVFSVFGLWGVVIYDLRMYMCYVMWNLVLLYLIFMFLVVYVILIVIMVYVYFRIIVVVRVYVKKIFDLNFYVNRGVSGFMVLLYGFVVFVVVDFVC